METFIGLDVSLQRDKCLYPEPDGNGGFRGQSRIGTQSYQPSDT